MWCVAELNDEYIAKMEDVLETYEKPYDPAEPGVFGREARHAACGCPPRLSGRTGARSTAGQ